MVERVHNDRHHRHGLTGHPLYLFIEVADVAADVQRPACVGPGDPADTRREAGVPDALYNCVCSFQSSVKLNEDTRLADIVPEMDAEVLRTLQPEAKLQRMACLLYTSKTADNPVR